eukprot:1184236-Rhodomonas_salina.1
MFQWQCDHQVPAPPKHNTTLGTRAGKQRVFRYDGYPDRLGHADVGFWYHRCVLALDLVLVVCTDGGLWCYQADYLTSASNLIPCKQKCEPLSAYALL